MSSFKPTSNIKNTILNFIKNLVSPNVYKAIKYILNPCCTDGNTVTVSITGLTINGVAITNESVKVVILTDTAAGFVSGSVNGSGNFTAA